MNLEMMVIAVSPAATADVLHLDAAAAALLAEAAAGTACEDQWVPQEGRVEGSAGTDFLRVAGFDNMLAFPARMLELSGLELYLETGEFLPVPTSHGDYVIWHHLAGASLNLLEKGEPAPGGPEEVLRFIPSRLPRGCALYTTPECRRTRLFITAVPGELPSTLGGPLSQDHPPPGFNMDDCRSLLQEYIWCGWSGLDFKIVWPLDACQSDSPCA